MTSFTVGTTRPQNGHWKSLNSTMVTLAFLGPLRGLCAGISTLFGPGGGGGCPAAAPAPAFLATPAASATLSGRSARPPPARGPISRPITNPPSAPTASAQGQIVDPLLL